MSLLLKNNQKTIRNYLTLGARERRDNKSKHADQSSNADKGQHGAQRSTCRYEIDANKNPKRTD